MRECEALCTRVGILHEGRFACMGSTQQLKEDRGRGATVLLRSATSDLSRLASAMATQFPGSALRRRQGGLVRFHVPGQEWHELFAGMEALRSRGVFQDYMVSDVSLTEVFLQFVRPAGSLSNSPKV